jgi:hypothetical protein
VGLLSASARGLRRFKMPVGARLIARLAVRVAAEQNRQLRPSEDHGLHALLRIVDSGPMPPTMPMVFMHRIAHQPAARPDQDAHDVGS